LAAEGIAAFSPARFTSPRGRDLLQHHPLGRTAVTGTMLVARRKDVQHLGTDAWGNMHRGASTATTADQPENLKPWLDQLFIDELDVRAEMSAFMAQAGFGF
jgi:argininosuccinate synthase